jgi:hypothetical protein
MPYFCTDTVQEIYTGRKISVAPVGDPLTPDHEINIFLDLNSILFELNAPYTNVTQDIQSDTLTNSMIDSVLSTLKNNWATTRSNAEGSKLGEQVKIGLEYLFQRDK